MTRYQLSRFGSVVYFDGRWFALNPSTRMEDELELHPVVADGLLQLADRPPGAHSREDWSAYLQAQGVSRSQAEATVEAAVVIALLVPEGTAEAWARLAEGVEGTTSEEVYALLSSTEALSYFDYGQPVAVMQVDRKLMAEYALQDQPPDSFLRLEGDPRIALPEVHMGIPAATPLERLGRLLYWPFGRVRGIKLHGKWDLLQKPVPSLGARHPFEVYLFVEKGPIAPGIYHYNVEAHELVLVSAGPVEPGSGTRLAITLLAARSQWRYRYSLAYKDLFLDLGHILEMLHVIEPLLGVEVKPTASATLPRWDGLTEACIATVQVSGL